MRLIAIGAVIAGLAPPSLAQPIATDRLEARMIIAGGDEVRAPSIPLIEERLKVAVDGQHATTTLLQVFQHGNAGQIEGQYKLRPGMGSRVDGFAYWNGEQKIVGEVFERQMANRVYDNVTQRRRDPGLLEEDGEGAFKFKVFPIQPQEKKRVELRWTKWLQRHGKTVTFRAPTTRGDAEIVIDIAGAIKNVRSTTHRMHVERTAAGARLRSEGGKGELVVAWDSADADWTPNAYVHGVGGQHDGWFAVSLATGDVTSGAIAAKDVTIVIDRSGSMTGDPLVQAKAAAADVIARLDPRDRVNVVAFSDEVDPLFQVPHPVLEYRGRAEAFVERLQPGGGTDIGLALETAIASQEVKAERPRVVVFMTDGQSDIDKAIDAAKADTGDIRLFTIGLGKDVNKPLLQRLAAQKRGRFTYIERMTDIKTEVARLASHIAKPLLVGTTLEVEGAHAIRLYPRSLPDLFVDDELVVTGRLRGTGVAKFTIKGKLAGKPVAFSRTVDLAKAPVRPWVGKLWAQSRVDHLLEEIALGATQPEVKTEVLDLALAYNFVTPYTAFLAIPESELGSERGTVEAARERKKQILAQNPDVANLDKAKNQPDPSIARDYTRNIPAQGSPPPPPSPDVADSRPLAKQSHAGPDDEDAEGESVSHATVQGTRGRGCAGCATGGDAGGMLGLIGLTLVLLRRRRAS